MKTTYLHTCFLLLVSMAMTACLNNDRTTVVLPTGTVSHNVIPDELRDVITDHIPVYEGNEIPNISGYFLADNVVSLYCSDEGSGGYSPGDSFADEYFYFGEITSRGLIYEYMEREGSTYFSSNLVQVMGDGNNFTAYYVTESNRDVDKDGTNETWSKISTILSGTITADGITNWKKAIIMVDKIDPQNKLMDVNVYRVFEESDGIAERISPWTAPERRHAPGNASGEEEKLPSKASINQ